MAMKAKIRKHNVMLTVITDILIIVVFILALAIFTPSNTPLNFGYLLHRENSFLIEGTAANHQIKNEIQNFFGTYTPQQLSYNPKILPVQIEQNLTNVDRQSMRISDEIGQQLEKYGFAFSVNSYWKDIHEIYESTGADFITTDLCLHAYHVLYDLSLRILEGTAFFYDFEVLLNSLRAHQSYLNTTTSNSVIHEALMKNIAYLSVMLYLLNNTANPIPPEVTDLVNAELANMEAGTRATSAIFGYEEDYSQYKVRGHYTRNEILANYFKAMMYAGRMSFLLQSPFNDDNEMGIEHTRMALLLVSSFNTTIDDETGWDYWDRVYQPTKFYVGDIDDLMPSEFYEIWEQFSAPQGDLLADDGLIMEIINELKTCRKPQINSMIIEDDEFETATQGFRLMGQRFIPDSYIFQQLVHNKVPYRLMPIGLDVFSVFGSPRAAFYLQTENKNYPEYNTQILNLREQFSNFTDYEWTQNLYWAWLYTLFPLLKPSTEGYPNFMLNEAWLDKALMTALGSWAELRHDTILYAKQSYTPTGGGVFTRKGYVEPYPEVYSRLASLVRLMNDGLASRGLLIEDFSERFNLLAEILDRLTEISIKELKNARLNEADFSFIGIVAEQIADITKFKDPVFQAWVNETDDRMAIIADVHTDPNSEKVLEVATGNPFVIYVVVQNPEGELYLTRGGTYSYYEFKQPMTNRLTDEEWHNKLDTDPPALPCWFLSIVDINKENFTTDFTTDLVDTEARTEPLVLIFVPLVMVSLNTFIMLRIFKKEP
ncbi:MAG: DUF3160 domain-containing protein [Promethearchaeota archaeon]